MGELHCGKGLDTFTPQGCGNLVYSYGKQAQLAAETVKRVDGISSASTGRLFVYSTICVDVGESLIKRLFNCCAETDIAKFGKLACFIVDVSAAVRILDRTVVAKFQPRGSPVSAHSTPFFRRSSKAQRTGSLEYGMGV